MTEFVKVLSVQHFTDDLFVFETERPTGFQFVAGQFTMIGMGDDDTMRAYSVASGPTEKLLRFYSIKVQDGPLTSRLQHIKPGDTIELGDRPVGTLLIDNLTPAKNLWLISTGTGLAPFLSIVRDPRTYEKFERVILTHTVRDPEELAFKEFLENQPIVYYPTVTRGFFKNQGRITDLISSGKLFDDLNIPRFDLSYDRIMFCGNPAFNDDLREYLESNNWKHGTMKTPGHFVQERAFVTQNRKNG